MCAFILCVHLRETKDLTAHLNSYASGIAAVGREGRTRGRGKYELTTFIQLPHHILILPYGSVLFLLVWEKLRSLEMFYCLCPNLTSKWKRFV